MTGKSAENEYDVIVVGAGPAGCSAAAFIAKQGFNVLLLDKAVFPRDKICGDGVSGPSMSILKRMDVLETILKQANPWNIRNVLVSAPSNITLKAEVPYKDDGIDGGYVIPRKILDALVVEHLKSIPNIDVRENVKVTDLVYKGDRVCGVMGQFKKIPVEYRGKYIIGADGAYSTIAKKVSLFNDVPKYRAFAVRAYFDNVEELEDTIELHYETFTLPGYGWLFPTGKTSANVGVVVFNRYKNSRGIDKLFNTFITSNNSAKRKLKNAIMVENSFKGWPLTYGPFPSRRSKGNVLLIGDSASLIDPLSGEGIYYALKSGEYAAEAVTFALSRGIPGETAAKLYEKKWKKGFKWKEYVPGYIFQTFFNKPWLIDFSIKRACKYEKKARTLAGVLAHKFPKSKLFLNL